jgi:hypothetical protein
MTARLLARSAIGTLFVAGASAYLMAAPASPDQTPDGRAPTRAELTPSVEAAFERESYAPGDLARLVISNKATGVTLRIYRSGPERIVTRSSITMNGALVRSSRWIGTSRGRRVVRVRIGNWASGVYYARLRAADGRVGFAPFVVRPRRLGEHSVAVVLPTLTWQAYNLRDDNGDGEADSWYANWKTKTVRLGRPYLSRGVPNNFHRYDLPFLQWLDRTGKRVDVLAQSDLESARNPPTLAAAYDAIVFPGHHEYVTTREYDLVEGYRDLGGNLLFLSANNFFWQVVKRGDVMTRTKRWRDLDRAEASLVGVQYRANGKAPRRPWIVRRSKRGRWLVQGTGLRSGSAFGRGGVEIDTVASGSPRETEVLAEIPNVFGSGLTAQMTYYETRRGARVFAAGAFYFTRLAASDPVTSRILDNLWVRMARP